MYILIDTEMRTWIDHDREVEMAFHRSSPCVLADGKVLALLGKLGVCPARVAIPQRCRAVLGSSVDVAGTELVIATGYPLVN